MIICGLDECGRGALAGPLVAAGVILRCSSEEITSACPIPIRDSKKINPKNRQKISEFVQNGYISKIIKIISTEEINEKGISWANHQAFTQIIDEFPADHYIVDGNLKITANRKTSIESIIKADDSIIEVAIASIIAKVFRDNLMEKLHQEDDRYFWSENKGYGTVKHIQALHQHGPSPHHRHLFVSTALKKTTSLFN
jgi:ribonuclease HII